MVEADARGPTSLLCRWIQSHWNIDDCKQCGNGNEFMGMKPTRTVK